MNFNPCQDEKIKFITERIHICINSPELNWNWFWVPSCSGQKEVLQIREVGQAYIHWNHSVWSRASLWYPKEKKSRFWKLWGDIRGDDVLGGSFDLKIDETHLAWRVIPETLFFLSSPEPLSGIPAQGEKKVVPLGKWCQGDCVCPLL